MPAGLGLAHLGLPFHRHLDPHVYEVHSGVPAQNISVSVASGSFNPCARPFGPFDQTTCNPWFRGFVHMSLHSCTEDGAHIVEVLGRPAKVRPTGLGLSQFCLIFGMLVPAPTTHPKLVEFVRNK